MFGDFDVMRLALGEGAEDMHAGCFQGVLIHATGQGEVITKTDQGALHGQRKGWSRQSPARLVLRPPACVWRDWFGVAGSAQGEELGGGAVRDLHVFRPVEFDDITTIIGAAIAAELHPAVAKTEGLHE